MISKSNTVFDSFFIELNNITLENCHPFEIVLKDNSFIPDKAMTSQHGAAGNTKVCLSKIGYILHNFKA